MAVLIIFRAGSKALIRLKSLFTLEETVKNPEIKTNILELPLINIYITVSHFPLRIFVHGHFGISAFCHLPW